MCKKCKQAVKIMTKKTNKEYAGYWLWNETSYPFDSGDKYLKMAKEFRVSPLKV